MPFIRLIKGMTGRTDHNTTQSFPGPSAIVELAALVIHFTSLDLGSVLPSNERQPILAIWRFSQTPRFSEIMMLFGAPPSSDYRIRSLPTSEFNWQVRPSRSMIAPHDPKLSYLKPYVQCFACSTFPLSCYLPNSHASRTPATLRLSNHNGCGRTRTGHTSIVSCSMPGKHFTLISSG
jgi:hypothetical protein